MGTIKINQNTKKLLYIQTYVYLSITSYNFKKVKNNQKYQFKRNRKAVVKGKIKCKKIWYFLKKRFYVDLGAF